MKLRLLSVIFVILMAMPVAFGQKTPAERAAWLKELTQYKHEFLAKELALTDDQQRKFFALYDAMEAETRRLIDETRRLEKSVVEKGAKASDTEREKAAEAVFELKGKENAIEMKYFAKFKQVLTPAQLLQIKPAERKFNRVILKEHAKRRHEKKR